ncbi:unnamed protein product [Didymodactylos carnosus]|uniref:Uncharacterized protein n=1 Tax=Didymodactylos carnosus TaxID=1234261 RepID=A0A8S2D0H4_9BILA|nr:unnamed protein product [Didymodactylos carnosus]CAF3631231.1 unnamed protein product [Didymodactylos carnosus]
MRVELNHPVKRSELNRLYFCRKQQPYQVKYFDLRTKPTDLKSKSGETIFESVDDIEEPPENGSEIPKQWNVHYGDVISWSYDRPTETYFVTKDGKFLKNPDLSGSGYLTIPLSITRDLTTNTLETYKNVIEQLTELVILPIELNPEDEFFSAKFNGSKIPKAYIKRNDIEYSYSPMEQQLTVQINKNGKKFTNEFPTDKEEKLNNIIKWIKSIDNSATNPLINLIVKCNFNDKSECDKVQKYKCFGIIPLPKTWTCEQKGGAHFGQEQISATYKCQGPLSSKQEAIKKIKNFYKDLKVDITEQNEEEEEEAKTTD